MRLVHWLRSLSPRSARPRPRRARLALEPLEERAVPSAAPHDILYVGDGADNSVKSYDATTGAFLGTVVAPGGGGLDGPRGMIFRNPGQLLVANQNVDQNFSGEVLRYNGRTGNPLGAVVPSADPNAPFAPRGMVLRDGVLYVASVQDANDPNNGEVDRYDVHNGKFLGKLTPANFPGDFNPRGVVLGPDGGLYVSSFDVNNPLVGYVVRFDPVSGASRIVAANNGDGIAQPGEVQDLHRPEGLVFGPDGDLYVTSFRADATDTDKVLVLDPRSGRLENEIPLDQAGQPRAFAQAIEFGPGGQLFVPISGNGPDTGAVRRYDVHTKAFTDFVAPGGPLGQGWYLTFGQTDPATLAYDTDRGGDWTADARSDRAFAAPPAFSAPALSSDVVNALLSLKKGHNLEVMDGPSYP